MGKKEPSEEAVAAAVALLGPALELGAIREVLVQQTTSLEGIQKVMDLLLERLSLKVPDTKAFAQEPEQQSGQDVSMAPSPIENQTLVGEGRPVGGHEVLKTEAINVFVPSHSRTSCSDERLENGWGSNGRDEPPRCTRCALLQLTLEGKTLEGLRLVVFFESSHP